MLNLYRRHRRHCAFASMRHKRCRCPIWCWGTLAGKPVRKSLGLANWQKAQKLIQDWEDAERAQEAPITVQDATERFIEDAESRNLGCETLAKYHLLFRELNRDFGPLRLEALTVDGLARFREGWKLGPLTARKKIERLKALMSFCVRREWLRRNPAEALKLPQTKIKPRLPFTDEEWEKILWATEVYPSQSEHLRARLRAFVLLLRYSGLRIRDAVQLCYDRISEGKLLIYTDFPMAPNWGNIRTGNCKYMRELREQTSPCARRAGKERFAHVMPNRPVSSYTAGAQIDCQEFHKKPMPKAPVTEEVQVLRFFEEAPLEKAEMLFNIVKDKIRSRLAGNPHATERLPKRKVRSQSDATTQDMPVGTE